MVTSAVLALALLLLALVVFVLAAAGVVHARVQLVPLGLAAVTLAALVRLWPP
jgi:hypothetical protein